MCCSPDPSTIAQQLGQFHRHHQPQHNSTGTKYILRPRGVNILSIFQAPCSDQQHQLPITSILVCIQLRDKQMAQLGLTAAAMGAVAATAAAAAAAAGGGGGSAAAGGRASTTADHWLVSGSGVKAAPAAGGCVSCTPVSDAPGSRPAATAGAASAEITSMEHWEKP
jgi:hypothetical protein